MVCHRQGFNNRKNRPRKADAKTTTVETGDKTKAGAISASRKTKTAKTSTKKSGVAGAGEAESSNKQSGTRITKIKRCYALFGDAISFDPTYGTNKNNMKFAPFTGIDNHKKSITFGCVLLDQEDDDSFIWAFQQFLKAMGGKEPNYIISDQDAGIINAVPDNVDFMTYSRVQKSKILARYRFCMWHIMKKVTDKVESTICKETDFLSRLNNVVWNEDLEPEEFEENWAKVISEFSLEENKWLTDKFESAMDQQRHNLKLLEAQSHNSMPETLFRSNWEAHAVKVYTHEVFFDFQEEVKFSVNACSVCGYTPLDPVTNFEVSIVEDANKRKRYAVEWSKNALRNPVYDLNENLLENNDLTGNSKFGMSRVWSEIYATVGMLKREEEESDMREFAKLIKEFREKLEPNPKPWTKEQELETLLNCKAPKEIKILPPKASRNKGSGKRMVSSKNKAIMKAKKLKRLCAKCKRMSHHDKRNCPNEFAEHPPENQEARPTFAQLNVNVNVKLAQIAQLNVKLTT
ncbi:uncharacterized protein LOC141602063 [Silene latifolia]|uniref:uncharacterized protein LOC141602063 n=1 Tax=Silene latifolia TaxID=37657 RepID=UPI003D789348